ncbi:hypothetical protein [Chishuiella sp.]|uniref:hypothetical protein n=1 Tax=Chishuiella sp. TaxID=1969467 RepID=UPI0028ABE66F|nr:hypothetical protein [Chishuiella sp.]
MKEKNNSLNEILLFDYYFTYSKLGVLYNQFDELFEVINIKKNSNYEVYYENIFVKKINNITELKTIFKEKTGENLEILINEIESKYNNLKCI